MQRTMFTSRKPRVTSRRLPRRPPGRRRFLVVLGVAAAASAIATGSVFVLTGGVRPAAGSAAPASAGSPPATDVRQVIGQLVSVFENGTPEIQYGYIENLDDGRGYTAGRAGFCSACGDMLTVVRRYTEQVPDNVLTDYLPALTTLGSGASDSNDGLDGIDGAWRRAAEDPVFRAVQDDVAEELYVRPAQDRATANGVTSRLGLAVLVDTAVQHGTVEGPDSMRALVERTDAAMGGSPASGIDEADWLRDFLEQRRDTLEDPSSASTGDVWEASIGRVDALEALLDAGNLDLVTPFVVDPWGDPQTIT
jgi:chitosanase